MFPGMEGRAVDVDDYLGAGIPLNGDGPHRIPDVLADAHADSGAVDGVNRANVSPAEVTVFVENPVVGQVHLAVGVNEPAVIPHGGGVGDVGPHFHVANHYRQTPGGGNDLLHSRLICLQERGLEQQVFPAGSR